MADTSEGRADHAAIGGQLFDVGLKQLTLGPAELGSQEYLPHSLKVMTRLQQLRVYDTEIKSITSTASGMRSLQSLTLEGNTQFRQLDPALYTTPLRVLCIHKARIESLHSEIGLCSTLANISCTDGVLSEVPGQLFRLPKLAHLNFSNNCIDSLPDCRWSIENLLTLDLSKNNLETLPAGVGHCINLRSIQLRDNALRELPVELGTVRALQEIDCSHNNLRALPETIGDLTELHTLWYVVS